MRPERAFTDNSGQVVVQLVECRRQCAVQQSVAVVEPQRDCLGNVVGQQTVHVTQGARTCPSGFLADYLLKSR